MQLLNPCVFRMFYVTTAMRILLRYAVFNVGQWLSFASIAPFHCTRLSACHIILKYGRYNRERERISSYLLILSDVFGRIIREHGSVSLCRDGQKTKWRLQCKY